MALRAFHIFQLDYETEAQYISIIMLRLSMAAVALSFLSCNLIWGKTFDFRDPRGFNSIEFSLAGAPGKGVVLGSISEVEGTMEYDPSAPGKTTGTIEAMARSARASASFTEESVP